MESVGAYFAKTHLPQLLAAVEAGQGFIITKNGRQVAKIVPIDAHDEVDVPALLIEMKALRKTVTRKGLSVQAMRAYGRKLI